MSVRVSGRTVNHGLVDSGALIHYDLLPELSAVAVMCLECTCCCDLDQRFPFNLTGKYFIATSKFNSAH